MTGKGVFSLKKKLDDPSKSAFKWNWAKGQATDPSSFGNPASSNSYRLCVYDSINGLSMNILAPAGPSWVPTGKGAKAGFKYIQKDSTPEGIVKVVLKGAPVDGAAKIIVAGKGSLLSMPNLVSFGVPVTVQLVSGSSCWGATYSGPLAFTDQKFKAKND